MPHVAPACPTPSQGIGTRLVIGLLPGCGIGPEVTQAALRVLQAVCEVAELAVEVRRGGPIGEAAEKAYGTALPDSVVTFCGQVFADGGAILSGPGGGRYVYDLRRRFDLFCKLAPVRSWSPLEGIGRLRPTGSGELDLLFVRDNCGGVYQGRWWTEHNGDGEIAHHAFRYTAKEVRRLAAVALSAAAQRRGRLHVILKHGGVPGISDLWQRVVLETAAATPVQVTIMNADLAAFELVQHPEAFDVILTPNLLGDILVDLSAVLQGSRGLTFSGNFAANGRAVYQTNHGCAHDLAGKDLANPAGQILAMAMLLRESLNLPAAADLIENALRTAWAEGHRTPDLRAPGDTVLGTQAMGEKVAAEVVRLRRQAEVTAVLSEQASEP